MFLSLLAVTFLVALLVSFVVSRLFLNATGTILQRILSDPIYMAWVRYLMFAIYVVGISSGVRIWELERYINPTLSGERTRPLLVLNADRWVLELYRTTIGALQGIAWLLLVFFILALIGFVVVRLGEMKYGSKRVGSGGEGSA
ncbi:MAG: hypothetical protein HY645_09070 [Acidobacteria bacterium]|nr:hypothetical protein [Acidobacteriota bacterium]